MRSNRFKCGNRHHLGLRPGGVILRRARRQVTAGRGSRSRHETVQVRVDDHGVQRCIGGFPQRSDGHDGAGVIHVRTGDPGAGDVTADRDDVEVLGVTFATIFRRERHRDLVGAQGDALLGDDVVADDDVVGIGDLGLQLIPGSVDGDVELVGEDGHTGVQADTCQLQVETVFSSRAIDEAGAIDSGDTHLGVAREVVATERVVGDQIGEGHLSFSDLDRGRIGIIDQRHQVGDAGGTALNSEGHL